MPAAKAAAGEQGHARRRPVVAARRRVDLGRAAEVGEDHHQRLLEHAAVGKVLNQAGNRRVEPGQAAAFSAT